jgi:hypothetical protein
VALGSQQDEALVVEVDVQLAAEEIVQDNIFMGSSTSESSSSVQLLDESFSGMEEVGQPSMDQSARALQYEENTVRDLVLYNPVQVPQVLEVELELQLMAPPVFGPQLPSDIIWERMFQSWLPELFTANVPIACVQLPFPCYSLKEVGHMHLINTSVFR